MAQDRQFYVLVRRDNTLLHAGPFPSETAATGWMENRDDVLGIEPEGFTPGDDDEVISVE